MHMKLLEESFTTLPIIHLVIVRPAIGYVAFIHSFKLSIQTIEPF